MSTEIASRPQGEVIDYNAERKQVLLNTVAQGATPAELEMFIELCKATCLNPFKREVWFIKTKGYTGRDGKSHDGRVQIMTGINGFYEIANSYPEFDGVERLYGPSVTISISASKAPTVKQISVPEWVETKVFRKDRTRPTVSRVYWAEYAQELVTYGGNLSLWAQKPTVMLEKCADATALRKAFPQKLNGLYVEEEVAIDSEQSAEDAEWKRINEEWKTTEAQGRENYLVEHAKQLAAGNYIIELGSKRGTPLSAATNTPWLENHLKKHDAELSPAAKAAIQKRIEEIKREWAQKQDAQRHDAMNTAGTYPTVQGEVEGEMVDGYTLSAEEIAEIKANDARMARES